jgi:hypothetical protein
MWVHFRCGPATLSPSLDGLSVELRMSISLTPAMSKLQLLILPRRFTSAERVSAGRTVGQLLRLELIWWTFSVPGGCQAHLPRKAGGRRRHDQRGRESRAFRALRLRHGSEQVEGAGDVAKNGDVPQGRRARETRGELAGVIAVVSLTRRRRAQEGCTHQDRPSLAWPPSGLIGAIVDQPRKAPRDRGSQVGALSAPLWSRRQQSPVTPRYPVTSFFAIMHWDSSRVTVRSVLAINNAAALVPLRRDLVLRHHVSTGGHSAHSPGEPPSSPPSAPSIVSAPRQRENA